MSTASSPLSNSPESRDSDESPPEKLTFLGCLDTLKSLIAESTSAKNPSQATCQISATLGRYFSDEQPEDTFEGFLRLLLNIHSLKINKSAEQKAAPTIGVETLLLNSFKHFISASEGIDAKKVLECWPRDNKLVPKALKILTPTKPRHMPTIAHVFQLKAARHRTVLLKHIKELITTPRCAIKAVEWMVYYDVREEFAFEKPLCAILRERELQHLEPFVGRDPIRRESIIAYLDRLIGLVLHHELHQSLPHSTSFIASYEQELLTECIADCKVTLERPMARLLKASPMPDSVTPNLLRARGRNALLYFHKRWVEKGEGTRENYEENVMQAMCEDTYLRDFYLQHLCKAGLHSHSLHFAHTLRLESKDFPRLLRRFCESESERASQLRAEYEAAVARVAPDTTSHPDLPFEIEVVDDGKGLRAVTEALKSANLVGIDTEWRQNFTSTVERVHLIDVISLMDGANGVGSADWQKFFEALLCGEAKKIGFDFRHDLRVLASSFPELLAGELNRKLRNVICFHRMLSRVVKDPKAAKSVFGVEEPNFNIGLDDASKHFLGIKLDKIEALSNWERRPLRAGRELAGLTPGAER